VTAAPATERHHAEGPSGATRFAAYAVPSRSGPHVTMQAGVIHADRFWTTTSAASLKARSVGTHRVSSVLVGDDRCDRVLAGQTNRLRPFKPLDVLSDPFAPLRSTSAVVRLGVDQIEQLMGYFEAAGAVPTDWLPHRRVLLVTRIDRQLRLDGLRLVDVEGSWERRVGDALGPEPGPVRELPLDDLPDSHTDVVRLDRPARLGVETPDGPVVLPASWQGRNRFEVSASALRAVAADLPGRASVVFDDSVSRRPDEKLGVMFRGTATLGDVDGPSAIVHLHSERITTWDGFEADTRAVG
jgi:hypothetical protein